MLVQPRIYAAVLNMRMHQHPGRKSREGTAASEARPEAIRGSGCRSLRLAPRGKKQKANSKELRTTTSYNEVSVDKNTATRTLTLKQGLEGRKAGREPKENDQKRKPLP